jgi:hypothetical protein
MGAQIADEDALCDGCHEIDFTYILGQHSSQNSWNRSGGSINNPINYEVVHTVVEDIGHVQSSSPCSLCRFLLGITDGQNFGTKRLELWAFNPAVLGSCTSYSHNTVILSVVPHGHKGFSSSEDWGKFNFFEISELSQSNKSIGRFFRDTSGPIQWTLVRKWIEECDSEHSNKCKRSTHSQVPGLVVIDCEERQLRVRQDANTPYVALSYVWGNIPHGQLDENHGLQQCPQVIEDSIAVVKSLGMRYLWIDRYCIPQKDSSEKQRLIREMGRIYANSSVTLIAAASEGADCGLPGVSVLPRWESSPLEVFSNGESMLLTPVRTPFNSYYHFIQSKWKTRGWTYQEGLHARRRLVFTEGPLYLECQASRAAETNLPGAPDDGGVIFYRRGLGEGHLQVPELFPRASMMIEAAYIDECIREFSARNFTFEEDALDAFRGTLETFKTLRESHDNLSGLTYSIMPAFCAQSPAQIAGELAISLLWTTARGSIAEESSHSTSEPEYLTRRRRCFPTWTWLGWKFKAGKITYQGPPCYNASATVNITVIFSNGSALRCEDGLTEIQNQEEAGYQPTFLHIFAWSVSLPDGSFFIEEAENEDEDDDRSRGSARFINKLLDVSFSMRVSHDISRVELLQSSCKALLMNDVGVWLLVRKTAKYGIYERVGVLRDDTGAMSESDEETKGELLRNVQAEWTETVVG